jgi:hypothetical protein
MKFLTCPRQKAAPALLQWHSGITQQNCHRKAWPRLSQTPQRASKEVEAELRRFVTECDAIRDEVRRPLTEWEQAEESRKNALQQRLNDLRALGDVMSADGNYLPSVDIQARISEAKSVSLDDSWEEVAAEAGVAKDATIQKLEAAFIVAKQREDQAAELERLRVEAEEKARVEREEKLKREAAEAARLEAEKKLRPNAKPPRAVNSN